MVEAHRRRRPLRPHPHRSSTSPWAGDVVADEFLTLEPGVLERVSGGRKTHVEQMDPVLAQLPGVLTTALDLYGQKQAGAKQQKNSMLMQLAEQRGADPRMLQLLGMMQQRGSV